VTPSEELAAQTIGLCPQRLVAFAGAVCIRAREVFGLCRGATPMSTFNRSLERVWDDLRCGDFADIDAIFGSLAGVPESFSNDTLSPEWIAWMALATFESVSKLPTSRLPIQTIAQCSALGLTIFSELDMRIGWTGPSKSGELASAEWEAQLRCLAILREDPLSVEIPLERLAAAGDNVSALLALHSTEIATGPGCEPPAS
jgi:hypothetical protein